jgi:four helix bundle protein
MASFRDLVVWQRAFSLCVAVYRATDHLPSHERYGLSAELRKTARSVVYNIAEGHQRTSRREFVRFLDICLGSAAELLTQLLLVAELSYLKEALTLELIQSLDEVTRMTYRLKHTVASQANG